MNSDTLIRQLAEADVYAPDHDLPDSARTSTVALTEIRRRIDMDAKELTRPVEPEPPQRHRGWLVGVASFAVVLLVVAAVWMLQSDPADEPVDSPTTSTVPIVETDMSAVAEDVAYAVYSGDWETIEAVIADDFGDGISTDGLEDLTADGFRSVVAFYSTGVDVRDVDFSCRDADFGGLIVCDVEVADAQFDLPGDFRSNQLIFEFRRGLLTDARPHWDFRWAEALAELGAASDPDAYDVACRQTSDSRTINGVTYNEACGVFLAPYNDGLIAQVSGDALPTTTVPAEPVLDVEAVTLLDEVAGHLNSGDHAAASSIVVSAEQFVGEPSVPNDQTARFVTKYELWVELGSTVSIDECSTNSSGFTRCILSRTSERENLASTPEESIVTVRVVGGELTYFEQAPVPTNEWWIELGRLEQWLNENHPDVFISAYFSPTDAVAAADLREEYSRLWDAEGRP